MDKDLFSSITESHCSSLILPFIQTLGPRWGVHRETQMSCSCPQNAACVRRQQARNPQECFFLCFFCCFVFFFFFNHFPCMDVAWVWVLFLLPCLQHQPQDPAACTEPRMLCVPPASHTCQSHISLLVKQCCPLITMLWDFIWIFRNCLLQFIITLIFCLNLSKKEATSQNRIQMWVCKALVGDLCLQVRTSSNSPALYTE